MSSIPHTDIDLNNILIKHRNEINKVNDGEKQRVGQFLRAISAEEGSSKAIAILSNFTVTPLANYIAYHTFVAQSMPLKVYVPDFNQYEEEIIDDDSHLYSQNFSYILFVFDEHVITSNLREDISLESIILQRDLFINKLKSMISKLSEKTSATIIIPTLPLGELLIGHFIDYKSKAELRKIWNTMNSALIDIISEFDNCVIIDSEHIFTKASSIKDNRFYFYAKQYLSNELLELLAAETLKIVDISLGHSRKCIVVDLDNTIWKGILGDDGWDGVLVESLEYGDLYSKIQTLLKMWSQQGVMLTIVSKNDLARVNEAFQKRDDFVLKLNDFLQIKANWEPKSQNILKIIQQINIGSDSITFIDDSDFERSEVSIALPSINVIDLGDEPYYFLENIIRKSRIETLALTFEDAQRNKTYQSQIQYDEKAKDYSSIEEFLESLSIHVSLDHMHSDDAMRISQLSAKTNQCNFNKQPYNKIGLIKILNSTNEAILKISYQDKFCSQGIVGFIHLEMISHSKLQIRNLVLSCKVFSRNIEKAVISDIIAKSKTQNLALEALFIPNGKNTKYDSFYEENGFKRIANSTLYEYKSNSASPGNINYSINFESQFDGTLNKLAEQLVEDDH